MTKVSLKSIFGTRKQLMSLGWVTKNVPEKDWDVFDSSDDGDGYPYIVFKKEEDAVAYKLKWC